MSPATVVRGAVATPIEELDLDEAFVEAEARSRAGQDSEIWCRRDRAGRPMAYRVVVCDQREALGQAWEQIALFFAVGSDAGPKVLSELTSKENRGIEPLTAAKSGTRAPGAGRADARRRRVG
jgi:hypothetical protein